MCSAIKTGRIRVAFAGDWASIHPGLQHTLIADLLLSNQFEALVGEDVYGAPTPLGAQSWSISEDFKTIIFNIDVARKYSDGSMLTSFDYKRSWEQALRLSPKSSNNSLLDVLYKVNGFEEFEKLGQLHGIETPDSATLIVRFSSPFRMALDHFQGNRFSAYKELNGKFIGTGKFVITEAAEGKLLLDPNPWAADHAELDPVEVSAMTVLAAISAIEAGKLDVLAYSVGAEIPAQLGSGNELALMPGPDAIHQTLTLNLLPGRTFNNLNFRKALQYLTLKAINENPELLGNQKLSAVDPQIYLPLQAGRLTTNIVTEIVANGERYVPALIAYSKLHPLLVYHGPSNGWIIKELQKVGLSLAEKSGEIEREKFPATIYKTFEPDLIMAGFSVVAGDPDAIYHRLGKSGAIGTPMSYSERVADILESGRKILRREELDPHYQLVSRAILEEVPFVHLGFSRAAAIYRSNRVSAENFALRRNQGHLHVYRIK